MNLTSLFLIPIMLFLGSCTQTFNVLDSNAYYPNTLDKTRAEKYIHDNLVETLYYPESLKFLKVSDWQAKDNCHSSYGFFTIYYVYVTYSARNNYGIYNDYSSVYYALPAEKKWQLLAANNPCEKAFEVIKQEHLKTDFKQTSVKYGSPEYKRYMSVLFKKF